MTKALLLDIEGTLAPLSFVKEVMFPYSRERLGAFLREHWDEPFLKEIVKEAEEISGRELKTPEEAERLFSEWIDRDLKLAPLKELQGHLWEEGFKTGALVAPVYEDACRKLKEWKEKGLKLFVYSSGSVKAQKLFFSHSDCGDLTPLFDGFFDTRVGSKKESSSYEKIARLTGFKPEEILFISDNPEELEAARKAGLKVLQSVREGVTPDGRFSQIRSFEEIEP
ncbi:MAG: acireductone synthase [Aquificae bacterium]|nr:acireductone synthase [Aquificota bacterium]